VVRNNKIQKCVKV